jgi:hypothetical protein
MHMKASNVDQMNITGALRKIARIKGMISEIDAQVRASACFEEDKPPPFELQELIPRRQRLVDELIELKSKLALANCKTFSFKGSTYTGTEARRRLDELTAFIALMNALPIRDRVRDVVKERATEWDDIQEKNITRTVEKVWVSAMSKRDLSKLVEESRARFDELNLALETFNHTTLL